MRRAAKNTEGVTDFLCAALRGRALCSRKSLFCQSSTGTRHCSIHLPVFTPRYVYKCRAMSTYVYICRAKKKSGTLSLRLTEQFLAVPDGYRADDLGAFHSVSTDRFHLQVFYGREQWLLQSCASNVHKAGPQGGASLIRGPLQALFQFDAIVLWGRAIASKFGRQPCPRRAPTKGTYSIQAALRGLRGLAPIRCNYPGSGRSKSIQVDPEQGDSFFLDFFFDFADVSSSRFRQPQKVCPNSLQLPWVRAGFDGLCRIMTDYDGVFPFFRPLHA